MRYRTVIFDIDNTLIKSLPRLVKIKIINNVLSEKGFSSDLGLINNSYEKANIFFDLAAPIIKDSNLLWIKFVEVILNQLNIVEDYTFFEQTAKEIVSHLDSINEIIVYDDANLLCEYLYKKGINLFAVSASIDGDIKIQKTSLHSYFIDVTSTKYGLTKVEQIKNIIERFEGGFIFIGDDIISDYYIPSLLGCQSILLDRNDSGPKTINKITNLLQLKSFWNDKYD